MDVKTLKAQFLVENDSLIRNWAKDNQEKIRKARDSYSWGQKGFNICFKERNDVAKAISDSRRSYSGAVDLATCDKVIQWGFGTKFPLRDEAKVLEITHRVFDALDHGDVEASALALMSVNKVGIARATKIIGLSDQDNLCIYDSRVGNGLQELKQGGHRLIKCPPSRPGSGRIVDATTKEGWAKEYRKVIWTVEIIRNVLHESGSKYRSSDVEMGLFMLGQ